MGQTIRESRTLGKSRSYATLADMQPDLAEPTERASTYPPDLADLLPRARVLAVALGELPSRNRLMADLRVGAPKAKALRDLLADETQSDSAEPDPDPVEPTEPEGEPGLDEPYTLESLLNSHGHPGLAATPAPPRREPDTIPTATGRVRSWPLLLLAASAFVAIWSGWVGLGELTGFGVVHPLPGIAPDLSINSAITLPISVEAYAGIAMQAWLTSAPVPPRARHFARWSSIASLGLGAAGQVAYHLMSAAGMTVAPWPVITAVACLPIVVFGMGAALVHLLRTEKGQ